VLVRSAQTGEALYALNARRLLMPASNMKLVTLAAAAERLGWDYTYETTVRAAGSIEDGVLQGDLVVVGSGDPSIGTADGMAGRLFAGWAERLRSAGIRVVDGRVVGNDNRFDDERLGFGWSWDDLADDYAAGVSALQFNENAVRVTIAPGLAAGEPASYAVAPTGSGLTIENDVTTAAADATASITASRLPGSMRLRLRGAIPLGAAPMSRAVSVDNPTLFFVTALRDALIAHGIDVRGPAVDGDVAQPVGSCPADAQATLISYRSPPLSVLAARLMKSSQNLYAETFLKTMGAEAGTPTAPGGRAVEQNVLAAWRVPDGELIVRDGSGLSRYDYVTAETLVDILMHIDRDERLRGPFEGALPVAGRDGTLAARMKGTAAEGNARAKTGAMSNVRALSGYVTAADGQPLIFSILANNFEAPPDVITAAIDAIVVRLATFAGETTPR
jgi:D-alanyl-D-alanine carboxypeptidase/D-alanyl-D-alanine-endopeptidase (penicillin-binding protein 4)